MHVQNEAPKKSHKNPVISQYFTILHIDTKTHPHYSTYAMAKSIARTGPPEYPRATKRALRFFCCTLSATLRFGGWAGLPFGVGRFSIPVGPNPVQSPPWLGPHAGGFIGNLIEANAMTATSARKKSSATSATKLRREIKLDESQFAIYKTGSIDILNPSGQAIDVIGDGTKKLNELGSRDEIANSLRLVYELLSGNVEGVQLSPFAAAGLVDLLSRTEQMIDR